jgi:hypothetical protein
MTLPPPNVALSQQLENEKIAKMGNGMPGRYPLEFKQEAPRLNESGQSQVPAARAL